MRQNTMTVAGARLTMRPSAGPRTDDIVQLSVFSMTAPNAAMATIARSTNTTNIDRFSAGTSYTRSAAPLRMMANSS